jgi:hypothetical protein
MKAAIVVAALALPLAAGADEILLRSGGRLNGVVVERRTESIVIDVGPGRVTLPMRLVERIVAGTPAFEVYRERSLRLGPTDVRGWLDLALWARDHELLTQARQAFEYVASIDPGNPVAHRELGHMLVDGRWMTPEEGYRARGYVNFEGNWNTPEERAALIGERAAEAQARQAEAEAAARAREAEARARTAEAEARQAEAAAYAPTEGIPLGMAYGGYGYPYAGYGGVIVGSYGGYGGYAGGGGRRGYGHGGTAGPSCGPRGPAGTPPGPVVNPLPTGAGTGGTMALAPAPAAPPPGHGTFRGIGPTSKPAQRVY